MLLGRRQRRAAQHPVRPPGDAPSRTLGPCPRGRLAPARAPVGCVGRGSRPPGRTHLPSTAHLPSRGTSGRCGGRCQGVLGRDDVRHSAGRTHTCPPEGHTCPVPQVLGRDDVAGGARGYWAGTACGLGRCGAPLRVLRGLPDHGSDAGACRSLDRSSSIGRSSPSSPAKYQCSQPLHGLPPIRCLPN